jgi:dihydropyrimidinase
MLDLLIRGGEVVGPRASLRADVGVSNGRIVALAAPGTLSEAHRIIDADGLWVLPGAVDPHTHIYIQGPFYRTQDFRTSSIAAAHGGTTCFIDFAWPAEGESLGEGLARRRSEADGQVAIDYSLHCVIPRAAPRYLDEVAAIVASGVPSFKAFMTESVLGEPLDDGYLYAILQAIGRSGGILNVHAENGAIIDHCTRALLAQGKTGVEHIPASRPKVSETEAVSRALELAQATGCAVYFHHLSVGKGVGLLGAARAAGQIAYGETCPHYLLFTEEMYAADWTRAIQFVRFPPIRGREDQDALWRALADGGISCIGSDEVSAQLAAKIERSRGKPFNQLPGGMAQIETRVPITLSEGRKRGLSIHRLVELLATGPAQIFGLYPRKGVIAPGADADLVLYDPAVERTVSVAGLHQGTDYTVFEGLATTGWPLMTIAGGRVIVEDGQYCGAPGAGRFLRRPIGTAGRASY